ncbi:MAG: tripartite tricarboxylate transporter substrate binding protein [Rhizobiaceae bacterium]|nr:tripartite tricarboxylate transporter substrate binding protein [Hyphomicrobiales bacterium]NRB29440.1 tripartite tricarboxylate transporter substrate binding protein [Rhizobiaceae bacterium]
MKFTTKLAAGFAATAMLASGAALADSYPSKPIKIMVGFSAGGGTDTTARGFASYMHEAPSMNGMPAYIVNLPGASGQKAAKQVLGEDADGYTLYMINIGTFIAGELAKGDDRPYHIPNDFVNLGCASQLVTSLQVHSSNSAKTMEEFIANAKASGKEITWGTSGAATMHATIGHIFFDSQGIKHKKVPFKGGSKARAALVSQSVEAVFGGVNTLVGFENDIRALASAGNDRDPMAPDLATFKEQGVDGIPFTGLMCLFGKAGIPDEVKADVGAAIEHIAGLKGYQRYMGKNSLASFYTDSASATSAQKAMFDGMGPVVAQIIAGQ